MFARTGAIAAALFSMVFASGSAAAQDGPVSDALMNEMLCVYDGVVKFSDEDFFALADIELYDITEGEDFDRLIEMVGEIAGACVDQYGWDEDQTSMAVEFSVQGAASDTLEIDLLDLGVDEEAFVKIDDFVAATDDAALEALYLGTWRRDATARKRLDDLMVAAGLPNDAVVLELVHAYAETSVVGMSLMAQWLESYPEE